jgi:hypothetical protein
MVAALALALVFAFSYAALGKGGASLSVKFKPKSPKASQHYKLFIKGKALAGTLGPTSNRSEVDRFEQLSGTCAATTPAEAASSNVIDLGPVFVKAGKFKIKQKRIATKHAHTTIRFCIYLYHGINKLDATATRAYTT